MSDTRLETLYQVMSYASRRQLIHQSVEDRFLSGKSITIDSCERINFGSCSYLGLEHHPALIDGAVEAAQRYGTQFSSSKTYASLGLYEELEYLLQKNYCRPVIVSASTTLGHLASLPVVVGDQDAVILDMNVHSSVQMAAELLKARGITVTVIRHNDMNKLEDKIRSLSVKHRKIWYLADGIYSMYGEGAPMARLEQLLDTYEAFHLYIDDAHGMSWTGKQGRGYVRSQISHHAKMVLVVSLNKSFAAAGGAVILPNEVMAEKIRHCGGTLIFSGPIQPPMLGAACASAHLHLSDALFPLQQQLAHLIRHTNQRMAQLGLPQLHVTESPVFFVPVGLPRITATLIGRVMAEGFYVNPASFPALPMRRSGVRFMLNTHLTPQDIDRMLERLAHHYPLVLEEEGSHCDEVSRVFQIPAFHPVSSAPRFGRKANTDLLVEQYSSITELDKAEWNTVFTGKGNFTTPSLQMIESVFSARPEPENQWDFHYLLVRDASGSLVLAAFYTCALVKEDMFSSAEVSRHIEADRKNDRYHLVTKCVMLGSLATKGEHLYLDRDHPDWRKALRILIEHMQKTRDEHNAGQLFLRDFVGGKDKEFRELLLELGLTECALPNVNLIRDLSWNDQAGYMARLGARYRYDVRREILRNSEHFTLVTEKPQTQEEIRQCYDLYRQVHARSLEINVFRLPYEHFEAMCRHPKYDVLRLYWKEDAQPDAEARPVAVMFSFLSTTVYNALIVGLDDRYVRSHGTYKQILYHTVWRAWECGCRTLDLAFTADQVKKKVGATPHRNVGYLQVNDHFNQALLASVSLESVAREVSHRPWQ